MSFLDRFRNSTKLQNGWLEMTQPEQLQTAIEESFEQPVVLFKHSTRCGISLGAKYALEEDWNFEEDEMVFYYLDLINYRSISNSIAEELGVIHQSPQLIILRHGKVVHTSTHHAINSSDLKTGLEKAAI